MRRFDLKRLYRTINRKYLHSVLPDNAVVTWAKCGRGLVGECFPSENPPVIHISPDIAQQPWAAKIVLYHEITHLLIHRAAGKQHGDHGRTFQSVMQAFSVLGAFKDIW